MNETVKLVRAYHFAAQRHVDQRRKGEAAEPYLNHLTEVAELVARATDGDEAELIIAAVLHDVVEDTPTTIKEVADEFGEKVAGLVAEVTDDKALKKAERKRLQIEHAARASIGARVIKLADKTSNLRALASSPPADWPAERRAEYLAWSRRVVAGCRGANPWLEAQFDEAAQSAESALMSVKTDRCLIEVDKDGAVGPDFGWPHKGEEFMTIESSPPPGFGWADAVREWIAITSCSGDGADDWARAYLTADGLRAFLEKVFGSAFLSALTSKISDRDRYILFAGVDRRPAGEDRPTWTALAAPPGPTGRA
jgi:hypothetical protein